MVLGAGLEQDALSLVAFSQVAIDVIDMESAQGDAAHQLECLGVDVHAAAVWSGGSPLVSDG